MLATAASRQFRDPALVSFVLSRPWLRRFRRYWRDKHPIRNSKL